MSVVSARLYEDGKEERVGWLKCRAVERCDFRLVSSFSGVEDEGRGCAGATEGSVPASWTAFQLRYGHAFGFITSILVFVAPYEGASPQNRRLCSPEKGQFQSGEVFLNAPALSQPASHLCVTETDNDTPDVSLLLAISLSCVLIACSSPSVSRNRYHYYEHSRH